jgi:hypothetical protein
MNKSYVPRLTRRLLTLAALVGCLLMLAPTQAKADWLDCWGAWQWCTANCGDSGCLDQCDQTWFICEASSPPIGPFFKIAP